MTTTTTARRDRKHSWLQKILFKQLRQLQHGQLTLVFKGETFTFGASSNLKAKIVIHDRRFFSAIAFGGSIGAAESYSNGIWDTPDLTQVIRLMARNIAVTNHIDSAMTLFTKPLTKLYHFRNRNTQEKARDNISQHYDLGNKFFKLFLDPTMAYSSGYFKSLDETMEEASNNKFEQICQRLALTSTDRVLEIGTGWGGLAIYAAEKYGCHVTTTTISKEQHSYTKALIEERGLEDKITLLFDDYRDLQGTYDKVMSCEMIEAVGHEYLDTYFRKIRTLVKPQGKVVIQAITINDDRYEHAKNNVDFIQRYIFPGGFLPSTGVIGLSSSKAQLKLCSYEDFGDSYRETLKRWTQATYSNLHLIRELGLDEQFLRMWLFYFAYCEGAFAEEQIGVGHFEFNVLH